MIHSLTLYSRQKWGGRGVSPPWMTWILILLACWSSPTAAGEWKSLATGWSEVAYVLSKTSKTVLTCTACFTKMQIISRETKLIIFSPSYFMTMTTRWVGKYDSVITWYVEILLENSKIKKIPRSVQTRRLSNPNNSQSENTPRIFSVSGTGIFTIHPPWRECTQ